MTFVADTSVIIEKAITGLVEKGKIDRLLIPWAVVHKLKTLANKSHEAGFIGLEELQSLQELSKKGQVEILFTGKKIFLRPASEEETVSIVCDVAFDEDAILITTNKVQAESAKAIGVKVMFLQLKKVKERIEIETFFDDSTMSVHLKELCLPMAKKGSPGNWRLMPIRSKKLTSIDIEEIAKEIIEKAKTDPDAFVEISRQGSTIVQYHNYRIVIVKPPIADGWEITAIKPLKQLSLSDYNIPKKVLDRIKNKAQGILIAGEVGSGKSTLAQAIASFYVNEGRITKTVESPRDLVLPPQVTQYSKNFTSSEEMHDILFLSRPDNVIFDEVRDTPDFKLYIDLRLGGASLIGVIHSALPIDAIQRFIGRLDTGMIPSVLDTVIFVDKGKIGRVLIIKMVVKVPTGMTETDLARPVVEVRDFETNKLEFEIYSYGEETVIIPVTSESGSPVRALATRQVEREMLKRASSVEVQMVSDNKAVVKIPEKDMANVIGKKGARINKLEKELGIRIDVEPVKGTLRKLGKPIKFSVKERGNYLIFNVKKAGIPVDTFVDNEFVFTSISGKKGEIKINKKSEIGRKLIAALDLNKSIVLRKSS